MTLHFNVTGDHPAVVPSGIRWEFNGSEIIDDGSGFIQFSDDRLSLTLSSLKLTDEGYYKMTATNPGGFNSASLYLDVQGMRR